MTKKLQSKAMYLLLKQWKTCIVNKYFLNSRRNNGQLTEMEPNYETITKVNCEIFTKLRETNKNRFLCNVTIVDLRFNQNFK